MSNAPFAKYSVSYGKDGKGYRKALEKLWAKNKARGIVCEFGSPDLTHYKTTDRKVWRVSQVDPTKACMVLSAPIWGENEVCFELRFWGPMSSQLDYLWTGGTHYSLSPREVRSASGVIKAIGGIDICAPDQFDEVKPFVVEQLT